MATAWSSSLRATPLTVRLWAASTRSPSTALAVGRPPAPRPSSISWPTASPSTKTALNESRTAASGWSWGTMAGWTRTPSDAVGAGLDHCQQLDGEAEPLGRLDVLAGEGRDALPVDVAGHDLGPEGDVGQDGGLGGGVEALDVGRRVPLGVAEALRLGQGVLVAGPRRGHPGQDVVGRAVDDAHHAVDPLAGQRLPQRPDERDPAGHRGLEQQVDPGRAGCVPQLAPWLASSSLLAVTTGLPLRRACSTRSRVGEMPPMTSTTTSIVGSVTILTGVGGEERLDTGHVALFGGRTDGHLGQLELDARCARRSAWRP